MISYLKRMKAIHLLVAFALLLVACHKDKELNFNINTEVQLESFSVNGITGEINQNTGEILINLPFGSDVKSLTPVFELPAEATSYPKSGEAINFTGNVVYRISNGNLYKDYSVVVKIIPPLVSFSINNHDAVIDHLSKGISMILPDGTDLTNIKPEIVLQNGVSISPNKEESQDFSKPVSYTLTLGSFTVTYQVNVISNSINEYAFLGLATDRNAITNLDEKAAADWFFLNYPDADYISFQSIETGRKLDNYKVIWWHFDSAAEIPSAALTDKVTNALKAYRSGGGNLLLTSYATLYVEAIGVVPAGKGPNNVFGDFLPAGFIEENSDWGISFKGKEDHPIFKNLETYEPGKAYLLAKGTFRLNHTSWWFLPEWGGYGNSATWREQTGGVNLASENWDDYLDGRVGIAEWPNSNGMGNVVVIAFGAYDWYTEPRNGGSITNKYLTNIEIITKNTVDYLKND